MASDAKNAVTAPSAAAAVQTPTHEGAAKSFWRILTRFDTSKLQPYLALRNTAGVVLPLIAGYGLGMPRGGLAVAIGALNVSYSDGSDGYAARAKRMLLSSLWCALAVFAARFPAATTRWRCLLRACGHLWVGWSFASARRQAIWE